MILMISVAGNFTKCGSYFGAGDGHMSSGNREFAKDITQWAFKGKSVLQVNRFEHYDINRQTQATYKVASPVVGIQF